MKKLLFLASVAMMAFAATAFVSCKGDDDVAEEELDSYAYYAEVTDDALAFYDVTLTLTNGTSTETLALSTSTTFSNKGFSATAKTTGQKKFLVKKGAKVSVTPTLTLKSNWKDIAATYGDKAVTLGVYCSYSTPSESSLPSTGFSVSASKLTETTLKTHIEVFQNALDM